MKNFFNGLKFAIGYFTVFSVSVKEEFTQKTADWTLFILPFVGLLLALVAAGIYALLSAYLAPLYSGIVAAVVYFALYGFLHIEGLIDTVDGYYGKMGGKDPYEIMKEPHVGAMGIVWSGGFLILKTATIAYLLSIGGLWFFAAAVILSRISIGFVLGLFEISKKSILALMLQQASRTYLGTLSIVLSLILLVYITGLNGIILALASFFISLFVAYTIKKEIGFINGDVLGANIEVTELVLLFTALFLIQ